MSRDDAKVALATVGFLAIWTTVYGAASVVSGWVPWRFDVALPGEDRIPLVPGSAGVYLSMGGLLLLAPLVLRRWDRVRPLFAVLVVETLLAAAVFVAFPVTRREWIDPAPTTALMALADRMNLERNYLPSLHVAYATTAALALGRHARGWGMVGAGWATAIAAATLLLHQHYVLDVVAGVVLAVAADRAVRTAIRRDTSRGSARPPPDPPSPRAGTGPTPRSGTGTRSPA